MKCFLCDHDPACGHATAYDGETEIWLCHTGDHSCYQDYLWDQSFGEERRRDFMRSLLRSGEEIENG